jgi:hypothetical protein
LALSLIKGERAGEELEDLPSNEHPLGEVVERSILILKKEDKVRENLEYLWWKLRQGKIPIHTPAPEGIL